jgi:ribulose kinase
MLLAVAVGADGSPASVSWSGDTRRNIIVWMDHRAVNQAERINASNSPVLQYCGGGVSPEMQAPKVLLVFWHAYGSNCLYVRFWPGSS